MLAAGGQPVNTSISHWMVLVRGTFWTVQMLMLIYWVLALAHLV